MRNGKKQVPINLQSGVAITITAHLRKQGVRDILPPRDCRHKTAIIVINEQFRLMDVDDSDIDKIMNAEETFTLKNGTVKTKKAVSKTACYKLAGNSIVVSCLYHIFRTMFLPNQPENKQPKQLTLFDL